MQGRLPDPFPLVERVWPYETTNERSLERRRLKLMYAWQLLTMIDKDRLLTDGTVKSRTVVEFASGKAHT